MVSRRGSADREDFLSPVLSPEEAVRAATRASQAASRATARAAELAVDAAPTPEDTATSEAAVVSRLPWGHLLRVSLARVLLTLLATLLLWSVLPAMVGWTPRVILSGSMEPRIHVGDVVVTREVPTGALAKNQVVTVTDPDHPGRTRTHRILRREGDGTLVLKGDANAQADSSHVSVDAVQGVAVLRVPWVGRPAYWLGEQNWLALGGAAAVLGWALVAAFPRERRPQDPGSGDGPTVRRTSRGRRVAAAAAVAAVAVGGISDPAAAAFTRSAANAGSSLAAASNFYPYRTAVMADSPHLFWRLDEASGTVVSDETTANRPGTLRGGTYAWGQGGALASETREASLSTTTASITANTAVTSTAAFSVEAWVKTTSTTGGRILGFGDKGGATASAAASVDRQLYTAPNGKVYFGAGSNKTVVPSTASIANGAWHHVVGTYVTGTNGLKLYVDGVLQGSATVNAPTATGFWRAGYEVMSGWTGNPSDSYFEGNLEELAVYTSTLSATRVKAHYDAGVTP